MARRQRQVEGFEPDGYVYVLAGGGYWKIGRSRSLIRQRRPALHSSGRGLLRSPGLFPLCPGPRLPGANFHIIRPEGITPLCAPGPSGPARSVICDGAVDFALSRFSEVRAAPVLCRTAFLCTNWGHLRGWYIRNR